MHCKVIAGLDRDRARPGWSIHNIPGSAAFLNRMPPLADWFREAISRSFSPDKWLSFLDPFADDPVPTSLHHSGQQAQSGLRLVSPVLPSEGLAPVLPAKSAKLGLGQTEPPIIMLSEINRRAEAFFSNSLNLMDTIANAVFRNSLELFIVERFNNQDVELYEFSERIEEVMKKNSGQRHFYMNALDERRHKAYLNNLLTLLAGCFADVRSGYLVRQKFIQAELDQIPSDRWIKGDYSLVLNWVMNIYKMNMDSSFYIKLVKPFTVDMLEWLGQLVTRLRAEGLEVDNLEHELNEAWREIPIPREQAREP